MKPRKHAELIKAWADGAEIERYWTDSKTGNQFWLIDNEPMWEEWEEYRIKPEPKPDVPDGMIDPKSYYQGYEDGKKYYLKKSPIGWIDELGTFVSASDYKELHEKLKKDMKPLYDIQEPKPDIEKYFVLEPITNDYGWVFKEFWAAIPAKAPAITCVFDGETGELKSAEVIR